MKGKHFEKNRRKREARRVRSRLQESESEVSQVPEWRRKGVRATLHTGAFADCSEEVQKELRETRAKMLVERNKVAVVKAEAERRRVEALLKSQSIERKVEVDRLRLDKDIKGLSVCEVPGFAETIVSNGLESVFSCASASGSGSVSPNSSVSVAELQRVEKLICDLVAKVKVSTAEVAKRDKELATLRAEYAPETLNSAHWKNDRGQGLGYSRWD